MKPRCERQWDELQAIAAKHLVDYNREVLVQWWEWEPNILARAEKETIEWWRHWRFHTICRWGPTPRHTTWHISVNQHGELFIPPGKERRCRGYTPQEEM